MTFQKKYLSHPRYRPDIDGLRAIAILGVVVYHAFPDLLKGGFVGVDIFFVISGFLITTIIFDNLEKGTFSFSEFYARRIRRIFPALILVLLVCFIFGWLVLLGDELNQLSKHIAASAAFISNFVLWNEAGYFDTSSETKPLLHLWSLAIEEQFYIVWPLLLWLSWKRKINFLIIITIVIFFSFILNIIGVNQDPVATFYSPQTRFWELLCGGLLSWLFLYKKETLLNIKNNLDNFFCRLIQVHSKEGISPFFNMLSFVGLFLLVYAFWKINDESSFPGVWALVPVVGTMLIISAGVDAWLNRTLLSNKILVWFGLISYPLYLWHWPILSLGRIINHETPSVKFRLIAIIISVFFSWITVKLIEKPFRFGNNKVTKKVIALCTILFALGTFGYIVSNLDLSNSQTYEKLKINRKDEYLIGTSFNWYKGKNDWLFLGNEYDQSVAKLKLRIEPKQKEIEDTKDTFLKISKIAASFGTRVVLIVGPNKSSIYPEYLPDAIRPSSKKYSSFFLDKLTDIPNLTVYDPTNDLLNLKEKEGFLYWTTDTHWNEKGAYLTYSGFLKLFNLPAPEVKFYQGNAYKGDLAAMSKLKDFPLHTKDNWEIVWKKKPVYSEKKMSRDLKKNYGPAIMVNNQSPLISKYVWTVGDSFEVQLQKFFNATFEEVLHVGNRGKDLKDLAEDLISAKKKPDFIVIVRVERSF